MIESSSAMRICFCIFAARDASWLKAIADGNTAIVVTGAWHDRIITAQIWFVKTIVIRCGTLDSDCSHRVSRPRRRATEFVLLGVPKALHEAAWPSGVG